MTFDVETHRIAMKWRVYQTRLESERVPGLYATVTHLSENDSTSWWFGVFDGSETGMGNLVQVRGRGLFGIGLDEMTARRRAEDALRAAEDVLEPR